jgi:hydrogenase maturation protease
VSDGADHVLVLGVGNLLWADEGFGVRCVEAFAARYAETDTLTILDGGTQGLALVPHVARATHMILFDAADFHQQPGSLIIARDADVPGCIGADKMSLHQAGVMDILACVELLGKAPRHITLVGVQPVELDDYGGSLTAPVRAQIEPALAVAVTELAAWNVPLVTRSAVAACPQNPIGMENYETGRPLADEACRIGDGRVLSRARSRAETDAGAAQ